MASLPTKHELEFLSKEQVAEDAYSFFFQRTPDIDFTAGQFMRLALNLPEPSEKGNGRFFSIASSPTEKDHLMITVRTSSQIYKKTLLNLKKYEKVQITLPFGAFTLSSDDKITHVFLAGGIGITPFRSMVRYAFDSKLKIPIVLFTSFKRVEDIVFQKEFRDIAANNNWFQLIETITQPKESKINWTGNVGRIDEKIIQKYVTDLTSAIFYIAGPPLMVDAMKNMVTNIGVDANRIRIEKFTGY